MPDVSIAILFQATVVPSAATTDVWASRLGSNPTRRLTHVRARARARSCTTAQPSPAALTTFEASRNEGCLPTDVLRGGVPDPEYQAWLEMPARKDVGSASELRQLQQCMLTMFEHYC